MSKPLNSRLALGAAILGGAAIWYLQASPLLYPALVLPFQLSHIANKKWEREIAAPIIAMDVAVAATYIFAGESIFNTVSNFVLNNVSNNPMLAAASGIGAVVLACTAVAEIAQGVTKRFTSGGRLLDGCGITSFLDTAISPIKKECSHIMGR